MVERLRAPQDGPQGPHSRPLMGWLSGMGSRDASRLPLTFDSSQPSNFAALVRSTEADNRCCSWAGTRGAFAPLRVAYATRWPARPLFATEVAMRLRPLDVRKRRPSWYYDDHPAPLGSRRAKAEATQDLLDLSTELDKEDDDRPSPSYHRPLD